MTPSPELTGGTGFTFERAVTAGYLVSVLSEGSAPGLENYKVTRVAVQQAEFGEPLDDLIVDGVSSTGEIARLSLQVKTRVTISNARSNSDFRKIIKNSWHTLKKEGFQKKQDRFGFIAQSCADFCFRSLRNICAYARHSNTASSFERRFANNGNASRQDKQVKEAIQTILCEELNLQVTNNDMFEFFCHLVPIKQDFLHEGAITFPSLVAQLKNCLVDGSEGEAHKLFAALQDLAAVGAGFSSEFCRVNLLAKLKHNFQLRESCTLRKDIETV